MLRRRWTCLAVFAVIFGTACRLAQYFSNQSFWGDESFLVLNIRAKSPAQLLGSLTTTVADNNVSAQTAPPLYLLTLKALAKTMGETEYAYRLPALLAGAIALVLMAILAFKILPKPSAAIAVLLLALCDRLIDAAALVKQYSGDVAAAVLLTLLAVARPSHRAAPRLLIVSIAGAILVWYSEPVVFITGGIALALLPQLLKETRGPRGILLWLACCLPAAVSFAAIFFLSMRYQQSPHLFDFWVDYFPNYHHLALVPLWLIKQTYTLFNYPYHPLGAIMLAIALWGILCQKQSQLTAILVLPMFLTLIASILHLYPFGGARVDFFLVPGVILLAAAGLPATSLSPSPGTSGEGRGGGLPPQPSVRLRSPQAVLSPQHSLFLLLASPMLLSGLFQAGYHLYHPRCSSHLRPALDFVRSHYQSNDTIVLTGGATWPVFYTYWPDPPIPVIALSDGQTTSVSGRFWCLCEFAPGEYDKKRKPNIEKVSAGATPVAGNQYLGKGGVAMLFQK